MSRPPIPPFNRETAIQKVRLAEDGWNGRDPVQVALAYTIDSVWRNRAEFLSSRAAIEAFLARKWAKELNYRIVKELWAFRQSHRGSLCVRIPRRCGNWFRAYGNENWEFDPDGLMRRRVASINDASDCGNETDVLLADWAQTR
ncbi:DUF1348 family protein [Bradyrhizobium sp. Ash2021]|uniref:DUF1348 family protein n=1 Tax=Bradyrhizobium sp. Ash2021 TaxID=2954771 RepID=UPI0035BFEFDD